MLTQLHSFGNFVPTAQDSFIAPWHEWKFPQSEALIARRTSLKRCYRKPKTINLNCKAKAFPVITCILFLATLPRHLSVWRAKLGKSTTTKQNFVRFRVERVSRCRRKITTKYYIEIDREHIYLPDISKRANTWPNLVVSDLCNVLCTRSNACPSSFCLDWMINREIHDRSV